MEGNILNLNRSGQITVAYLERTHLQFYGNKLSGVVSLDFPPTIVNDLEIKNPPEFRQLVQAFVAKVNLTNGPLVIILAETTYFAKNMSKLSPDKLESETQSFQQIVPFEQLLVRTYPQEKGYKIVAFNRGLYDILEEGFSRSGLKILALLPNFVLGTAGEKRWLDAEMGKYVLENWEKLKDFNLASDKDLSSSANKPAAAKNESKRLYVLIGIFILLLLILVAITVLRSG